MDQRLVSLRKFFYSHYFFGGVRQGVGMMLPFLIVGGLMGHYVIGLAATFGAQCLAIIDQPAGPQRHRTNEMLGGGALGVLAVVVTGVSSTYPLLLWAVVIIQCFIFSMFSVFGKRGGLIGFASLLLMIMTMHSPIPPSEVGVRALSTLGGALFYLAFSLTFRRLLWLREERQALSIALFATAEYMQARAGFYDETTDLDDTYRILIARQSAMTEKHQAARDLVLRALPRGKGLGERHRVVIWNVFVDMLRLLDVLVATHTDYATVRRAMQGTDILLFMRDAMVKMSLDLSRVAEGIALGHPIRYRASTKAELRAIEYEIEQFKKNTEPGTPAADVIVLLVQILRRMRSAARIVERLAEHTKASPQAEPTDSLRISKSLTRFLSRQDVRLGVLTSNLSLRSPHFRYALRVTIAAALAMTVTGRWLSPAFSAHSYWIMLTIVIVMKPGFALTRQRNGWRLGGTLIGCMAALVLLTVTTHASVLFAVLIAACIMGNSMVQINYMASAVFNTLFVVLVFRFISPDTVSMAVIGERALDTCIGCGFALVCSYFFPWWEYSSIRPLAQAAMNANREYLQAGLRYVQTVQSQPSARLASEPPAEPQAVVEADLQWRLARKNVHIAFSNFAESFYRMMSEPRSHQLNVPEINNLLIQNHVMASQTTALIPMLTALSSTPPAVQQSMDAALALLDLTATQAPPIPAHLETEGDLAEMNYPVKQVLRAAQMIRHEMQGLAEPTVRTPRSLKLRPDNT